MEAIWRGLNWRLRFRALEFNKPGILRIMQMFGASGNAATTFTPTLANIGDRCTKFAPTLGLVLTAVLGNPPTMPASLTALSPIIAPQSNIDLLFTSKMREAPLELALLPYSAVISSNNNISTSFTTG